LRSIGSLAAVVAVILFLAWGAKSLTRGGPLAGRTKRPGVIEIISRTALAPRQSLCLVRVGQRMVLVGVSQDSLRTLDVISDADAVAALAGEASAARTADAERAFRASLERETASYDAPAAIPPAGRSGMTDVRRRLSAALAKVKGAAQRT
jgi:flagellar biogenesis protein FliO